MTLIELLVVIAIMAIGFVALLSGFAVIERQVGSTGDDAQLTSFVRQVANVIETQPTVAGFGQGGMPYTMCASASTYQTWINSNVAKPAGDSVTVTSVAQATGGTHTVSGTSSALMPIAPCGDYGVQQIKFKVSSSQGNTITRIVYKRWD